MVRSGFWAGVVSSSRLGGGCFLKGSGQLWGSGGARFFDCPRGWSARERWQWLSCCLGEAGCLAL